jgi:hypothetical protein
MNQGEVRVGKTDERVDAVHQGFTRMVVSYPVPIDIGHLVVNPNE